MNNFPSHTPDIGSRAGRTSAAPAGPRLSGAGRVSAVRRGAGAVLAVLLLSGCSKKFENMTEPVAAFLSEAESGAHPSRVRYCFADSVEDRTIEDQLSRLRDSMDRYGRQSKGEVVSATAARGTIRVTFQDAAEYLFTVEYGSKGWRILEIKEGTL